MQFGTPPRNNETGNFPQRMPPPLRAEGSMNYLQFITLIRHLWEDGHPDIPFRPVQSSKYSRYPVIVYGLQNRTPFQNENKQRFREQIYQEDSEQNVINYGQRFNNTIVFTVITEQNPEMCEAIIETFEDFMLEVTGYAKQLGVSDLWYIRRLPDREETRPDDDVEKRSVAYMVVLERVRVKEFDKIKEILIEARVTLGNYWHGTEFWAFDPDDENATTFASLYSPGHPFKFGDLVEILPRGDHQDSKANDAASFDIPETLPAGLVTDYTYQIIDVSIDTITLVNLNGNPVNISTMGMGLIVGSYNTGRFIRAEIIDEFSGPATPNY